MTIREGCYLRDLVEDAAVRVLPGVRLPDLPDYLRSAVVDDGWPTVFRGLRVALGPRERTLRKALARCAEHDTEWLAAAANETSTYAAAREALGEAWPDRAQSRPKRRRWDPPEQPTRRTCSPHLLQLCRWDRWKYDRWIVFDDLWATAQADLAASLLYEDPFRRA